MSRFNFGDFSQETLCVQAGYEPENSQARILPITQSTTYKYDSADEVADLFDLKKAGHFYSRLSNPTVDALEKKVAALEGGAAALATASGQAASTFAILTVCEAGDHIVALNNLYGGTYNLLSTTLAKLGITTTFVRPDADDETIQAQIRDNTKLIFSETIGNPNVDVLDIERFARIAHKNDLPLFVDNTFATPYLCNPIQWGADIVIHSATKYLDGHATSVGGIIVDSGKFDWTNGKFDCLTKPDPAYHGLSYTETFGPIAFIVKSRVVYMRDFGSPLSPFNAFLIHLGIDTLALRMERHSQNALEVAKYLAAHPLVEFVNYPFLENSANFDFAKKYLKGGSGVISFGIKGDRENAKKFIDSLKLISLVIHVADVRSHVLHPASTTHRQLSSQELSDANIKENGIRLSVGIENVHDIIADIEQAIQNSR